MKRKSKLKSKRKSKSKCKLKCKSKELLLGDCNYRNKQNCSFDPNCSYRKKIGCVRKKGAGKKNLSPNFKGPVYWMKY